jgi:hypothetical protein
MPFSKNGTAKGTNGDVSLELKNMPIKQGKISINIRSDDLDLNELKPDKSSKKPKK